MVSIQVGKRKRRRLCYYGVDGMKNLSTVWCDEDPAPLGSRPGRNRNARLNKDFWMGGYGFLMAYSG